MHKLQKTVAKIADGVVVGSVVVGKIETNLTKPEIAHQEIVALLTEMRQAMDG